MNQADDRLPRLGCGAVAVYALIFVAVPILTYIVGRFLDKTFLLPEFPPFPVNLAVGSGVFAFGLAIGIKSTRLLYHKGRGLPWGEVKQKSQSTKLVTKGLYACCRNPMTFGYSLLPCGMGIMFRSLAMTLLIPAIVFVVMITWLKFREEPRLEQRFGQVYRDYKRQTPFLVPRLKPLMSDLASSIRGLRRSQKTEPTYSPVRRGPSRKAKGETGCPDTPEKLKERKIRVFQRRLLKWYTKYGRDLPWRHTRDPYCILVSEMMLQQTQVDRVIPKYNEWLAAYPTFGALAEAPLEEVQKLWRPLGYNFRPERLHRIARYVVNDLDGKLPNTFEKLIALPGIGRYTAGAILSFAFSQDAPIVDTNVHRLIQRIFTVHSNTKRTTENKEIWHLAEILIPHGKAFIFNQALIDFGALICTARDPACSSCIMKDICAQRPLHSEDS